MNIQKLKIATYCITKRLQGYQLLKNPKGSPATTVKVLKYSENINPKTLDVSQTYETISKDFSRYNTPETMKNLDIIKYKFYNPETNKFRVKKQVDYEKHKSDYHFAPVEIATKGLVSGGELAKRNLKDLSTVVGGYAYTNKYGKYVTKDTTRADLVIQRYNRIKVLKDEQTAKNQPAFWQTLWQNLSGK